MHIILIGTSHKATSFSVLEKAAVGGAEMVSALGDLKSRAGLEEVVLLSTCSRVEAIAVARDPGKATASLESWWRERAGCRPEEIYSLEGASAVEHLFRVAAGLDSWILGESEILRQVKDAYAAALAQGATGAVLNRLFQKAMAAGKSVRAATGLQNGIRSIGGAAALLAKNIFDPSRRGQVTVFGAGQAAEAVVKHLAAKNFRDIRVANRTPENARRLADALGGVACTWEEGLRNLAETEAAVFSASAAAPLLNAEILRPLLGGRTRPLFLIDLGMPRNVDLSCGSLDGVYLYDLGDLKAMVRDSLGQKTDVVDQAEELAGEAAGKVWRELENSERYVIDRRIHYAA